MDIFVKLLVNFLSMLLLVKLKDGKLWAGEMTTFNPYEEFELGFKNMTGYGTEWIFFPDGNGTPHFVNLSAKPDIVPGLRSGQNKEIHYRLYTRENSSYIILNDLAESPDGSNIIQIYQLISNKSIKIVTHGWMASADDSVVMGIKDAYLKQKDVIVIGVDWSDASKNFIYPLAAEYTADVGSAIGQFLDSFCRLYNVTGDRLHLIGHSLGAHVMGIAASTSNETIARVTGLDPALPNFEVPKKPSALSLDSSDADFVDVIHTCSGVLGVQNPIGHADFYPNSGAPPQPGCGSIFFIFEACSHGRSHTYFAESIINPTGFPACKSYNWTGFLRINECKQQTYMGDNVDRNARGQYYLKTNAHKPYARANTSEYNI